MNRLVKIVPIVCLVLSGLFSALSAQTPVVVVAPRLIRLNLDGHILAVPYFRNYSLDQIHDYIKRAVIVIHGSNRNARDYYERILNPARRAGRADSTTLILAPQFLLEIDIEAFDLLDYTLFWSSSGWKKGDESQSSFEHERPAEISSFAIIDTILFRLVSLNPNLQNIVLAGHSAGGQFVNRYAAGNQTEAVLMSEFGIQMTYLVANPSSYLYFSEKRRVGGRLDQFAVPSENTIQDCPNYHDYKYGLKFLNRYMKRVGAERIRAQYPQRRMVYFLGADDNNPNSSSLDKSCAAMLQGKHRLERGRVYYHYLQEEFGGSITEKHKQVILPGVGHSSEQVFASDCGVYFLFDYGDCEKVTGVAETRVGVPPDRLILRQNYPNPFNAETRIEFHLLLKTPVKLNVFNLSGGLVKELISGDQIWPDGAHSVIWNGKDESGREVSCGMCFYQIKIDQALQTKRLILLK